MARPKEFEINEVLDRALLLFWEQGYEKTSMQELVDTMGIHRKSIYDTFGDKHALFIQALQLYIKRQSEHLKKPALAEQSVKEIIRQALDVKKSNDETPIGCFMVNTGVELGTLDPLSASLVQDGYGKIEEFFRHLIEYGQERGELNATLDATMLSHYLMNAWLGIRTMAKTNYDSQQVANTIAITLSVLDS